MVRYRSSGRKKTGIFWKENSRKQDFTQSRKVFKEFISKRITNFFSSLLLTRLCVKFSHPLINYKQQNNIPEYQQPFYSGYKKQRPAFCFCQPTQTGKSNFIFRYIHQPCSKRQIQNLIVIWI